MLVLEVILSTRTKTELIVLDNRRNASTCLHMYSFPSQIYSVFSGRHVVCLAFSWGGIGPAMSYLHASLFLASAVAEDYYIDSTPGQ